MLDRWPKFKPFPLNVTKKCQCCKVRNAAYLIDSFGSPYCKKTLCPLNSNTFNNNAPRVCILHSDGTLQAKLMFYYFRSSLPARCARKMSSSSAAPPTSRLSAIKLATRSCCPFQRKTELTASLISSTRTGSTK